MGLKKQPAVYTICGNDSTGVKTVIVERFVGTKIAARKLAREHRKSGFSTWVEFLCHVEET